MSPSDEKVENVNDDVFSAIEQADDVMLLTGGSREFGWEMFPDGSIDWHYDW